MLGKAAFRGAIWLVLSRFLGRAIDFCNLLVLARLLTPADFGLAALATAFVMIIDTCFEIPITQALVRLQSIDKRHLDTGFTLAILRSIVVALVVVGGAWPYSYFSGEPDLFVIVCVVAIGPLAKGLSSPAMVHFARTIDFRPTFVLEAIGKICALPISILIVLNGGGYWAIVANFVSSAIVATSLSYVFARYRPAFSTERMSDFSSFMGWFSSSQLVSALNWQFERLMIGYLSPNKDMLGKYSVANDLSIIPTQSVIGPALQPVMSVFAKISSDHERTKAVFLRAVRLAMFVGVPVSLGISLTADLVTTILLGPAWAQAGHYLMLFSLSVLPIPYFQAIYAASLATDQPQVIFRLNVVDLALRIMIVTPAFYFFSVEGALVGRLVLAAVMFFVYLIQVRRFLQIDLRTQIANLWKILASGLIMSAAVWLFRHEIPMLDLPLVQQAFIIGFVGAGAYGASLLAFGMRADLESVGLKFLRNPQHP
jgi:PST family polysaccharide transporter